MSKLLLLVSQNVIYHIVTTGPPIKCKFPRLKKLVAAIAKFQKLKADSIIQCSMSLWSSPLHLVRKPDGSWRPWGYFRRLNLIKEPDVYLLPNMLDFVAKAAGCTVFSKIDLKKGYHQRGEDISKTAIGTPFCLFEYKRMLFGLRNAGASFQRQMDRAIKDCLAAFPWVNEIVICSHYHEEHMAHILQVLQALREYSLVINREKCVWGVAALDFLGHRMCAAGVLTLPSYVAVIQEFP